MLNILLHGLNAEMNFPMGINKVINVNYYVKKIFPTSSLSCQFSSLQSGLQHCSLHFCFFVQESHRDDHFKLSLGCFSCFVFICKHVCLSSLEYGLVLVRRTLASGLYC